MLPGQREKLRKKFRRICTVNQHSIVSNVSIQQSIKIHCLIKKHLWTLCSK